MKAGVAASSPLEYLGRALCGDLGHVPDWPGLIGTANDEFVTPALFQSLRQEDVPAAEPEAMAYLGELDSLNCRRNGNLWAMVAECTGLLNAAGIVPTLIKGASEMALQDDPARFYRLMIDVDLLVEPDEITRAQQLFAEAGFERIEDSEYAHSPGSFWKEGYVGTLDLHAGLQSDIGRFLSEGDWQSRRELRSRDGLRFYVPDASMRLLINISHDMLHHTGLARGGISLRYLLPLRAQICNDGGALDWPWLLWLRRDRGFRLAFDLQMLMLHELFGMPLPQGVQPDLATRALHRRRLLKARHPRLADLEWAVVKPIYSRLKRH
ncbi:nucleotidyltransferase family protein [Yangia mangrovi]|uniref:Nucleotidyltransferase family protein n=1 Tax=Alloyangia mangrovi TaxID=1779329 RepID=A0A2A3K155_9RHOB|nr:nucleotidyltransferase family protein [Alloyangia mangrovi]MCA0939990.1 nucleotidyltransferase family protein [Alloyangia pacifica]MCA0948149.1 nucleotidyltransferase family protein [Alloyangia pacifica]MCT4373348.1 nucleotidyltransferase family protein [Alloyangia mangrovi]